MVDVFDPTISRVPAPARGLPGSSGPSRQRWWARTADSRCAFAWFLGCSGLRRVSRGAAVPACSECSAPSSWDALPEGGTSVRREYPVLRDAVAKRLREETYRRYGAEAPSGPPLDLAAASRRLTSAPPMAVGSSSRRVLVLVSDDDPRRVEQLLFAAQLGARVIHHAGGHLFPITHPTSTAQAIRVALASGS